MAPDIFDRTTPVCEIQLLGHTVKVPLGDILLRCFLYVFGDRISYGRFCWNNECGNCEIRCIPPGETQERTVRACMYKSRAGLRITDVPVEFRVFMNAKTEGDRGPESGAGSKKDGAAVG